MGTLFLFWFLFYFIFCNRFVLNFEISLNLWTTQLPFSNRSTTIIDFSTTPLLHLFDHARSRLENFLVKHPERYRKEKKIWNWKFHPLRLIHNERGKRQALKFEERVIEWKAKINTENQYDDSDQSSKPEFSHYLIIKYCWFHFCPSQTVKRSSFSFNSAFYWCCRMSKKYIV